MKVRDLMTKTVASCLPETNLAAAGALMWEIDCGVLPVVNDQRKVIGMLTDRDACIALTSKDRRAAAIKVSEVVTSHTIVCHSDDDIATVLEIMGREKVHRLPVVNGLGILEGIISMNDIVLRAEKEVGRRRPPVSYDDVVHTLQEILTHRKRPAAVAA
jgi:CBS domain-containing protein